MEILGVDIGGSGIKGAIVNSETGEILSERIRIETPQPATPQAVAKTFRKLVKEFQWNGIVGCGFPAAIKYGVVKTASNIDKSWINTDAAKLFSSETHLPVFVVNDADAAGIAEITIGAGKDIKGTVLMITVGTGIGTALFHEGKLMPNTELGHVLLGKKTAESYASGLVRKNLDLSWKEWALRFNEYLLHIEFLLWPDLIIVGGGISRKSDKFMHYFSTKTQVVPAAFANNAGIIGAAMSASYLNKNTK